MGRAFALLLPSCEDTSHTLASPECTSGPASALRHGAEQGSGLTSEPKFALLWMGAGSLPSLFVVVHKRRCCPLSTPVSTFCSQLCPPPTLPAAARCSLGERTGWSNRRHTRKWTVVLGKVDVGTPRSSLLGCVHSLRAACARSGFWCPLRPQAAESLLFRRQSAELFSCCEFCVSHRVLNSGVTLPAPPPFSALTAPTL